MSALTAYQKALVSEITIARLEALVEARIIDMPDELDTFRGLLELWRGDQMPRDKTPDVRGAIEDAISECQSASSAADEAASDLERLLRKLQK